MRVVEVALGFTSTHVLAHDKKNDAKNRVYGFGNSEKGQLGYGGTLTQHLPVEITENFAEEVV